MPTIRIYKQHRLDEYLDIRRQVFNVEQGIDQSIEFDEYDHLGRDDVIHFAYWHQKKLIASARAILLDRRRVKVGRVATLKEYRHKGYASRLMHDIELYFHNIGFRQVVVNAQVGVADFYKGCGYTAVGEPFLEANILHRKMVKAI